MNCEISQLLLDVSAAEIPETTQAQIHAHLESCPACRKAWNTKQLLGAALRAAPAPELSGRAAERLLSRVFATDSRRQHRRTALSLAMAAVVVAALLMGYSLLRYAPRQPDYVYRNGTLILQSEHPTTVGVRFDSGAALKNVRFTIDLPAGMQVTGRPGVRHLSWVGELRKGQNLLKLPVIAHAGTHGVLTAELDRDGGHRSFSLAVLSRQPDPLAVRLWHGLARTLNWRT